MSLIPCSHVINAIFPVLPDPWKKNLRNYPARNYFHDVRRCIDMDMHMQFRYLHVYVSLRRAAKAQTSMCIPKVSQNLHFCIFKLWRLRLKLRPLGPQHTSAWAFEGGFHVRIQGGSGPDPTPLKNHTNIGYFNNTGPDLLKKSQSYQSYKASLQFWTIFGTPFSLAGRWWPAYSGICFDPLSLQKKCLC